MPVAAKIHAIQERFIAAEAGRYGSLAQLLPWWGWVSERVILTRSGELLALAKANPPSLSGLSDRVVDGIVDGFVRSLDQLPIGGRAYMIQTRFPQHEYAQPRCESNVGRAVHERRARFLQGRYYRSQYFAAWCVKVNWQAGRNESDSVLDMLRAWIGGRAKQVADVQITALRKQVDAFERRVEDWCSTLLRDGELEILKSEEAAHILAVLANGSEVIAPRATNSMAHWRLALAPIETQRDTLKLSGRRARILSLESPPQAAMADMVREAWRLPCESTIVWIYRQIGRAAASARIKSKAGQANRARWSAGASMAGTEGSAKAMENLSATIDRDELQMALAGMEKGLMFGELQFSASLHGPDEVTRDAEQLLVNCFAEADAKILPETYGCAPIHFARLPGQPFERNPRTMFMSTHAAACLGPLFAPESGSPTSKHMQGAPSLCVFGTESRTPFYYDLFDSDIGHTLILGATGSGKSFLLNFLLLHALQYDPQVCILDLGGSYAACTDLVGGTMLKISPERGSAPFPVFDVERSESSIGFLAAFIERLLRHGGIDSLSGVQRKDLRQGIDAVLKDNRIATRRLSTLRTYIAPEIKSGLDNWCEGGMWGHLFDVPPAESRPKAVSDWQVVDLAGAAQHGDLVDAALHFHLERFRRSIEDPAQRSRVKIMVVDEAWKFLADPSTANYIAEAAKTWRKFNGVLVIATQSAGDIVAAGKAPPVLDSLMTRLFLANTEMPAEAGTILGLNEDELSLVRNLVPKSEIYLKRRNIKEKLILEVDPQSYWLYTTNAAEAVQRAEAFANYGVMEALEILASNRLR